MAPARCGDQLAGCSQTEARTTVDNLARFHAAWWGRVERPELEWIPYVNDPIQHFAEGAYNDGWENFASIFGDRLSARAMAIAERFKSRIIATEDALRKGPQTIAHGDLRYDNLFFADDGTMTAADWQIVIRAPGPYDIAYFMSQSVDPDERKGCEVDVLRSYHRQLQERGVADYTYEQCFDDYRRAAMFCLVYPVIAGGTLDLANERGVTLVTKMLERSVATILDLDCDELMG
jgi:thiamine kinase-like enzyme